MSLAPIAPTQCRTSSRHNGAAAATATNTRFGSASTETRGPPSHRQAGLHAKACQLSVRPARLGPTISPGALALPSWCNSH